MFKGKLSILLILLFPIISFCQETLDNGITVASWSNNGKLDSIYDYSSNVTIDLGQSNCFAIYFLNTLAAKPVDSLNNNFILITQDDLLGLQINQVTSFSGDTLYQYFAGYISSNLDSIYVNITWWLEASSGLNGRIKVKCTSSDLSLWSVAFPIMSIPPIGGNSTDDFLALPLFTGLLVPDPINYVGGYRGELMTPYSIIDSTNGSAAGAQYPARMFMQYEAYYDANAGLYFQTTDTLGRFKEFIAKGFKDSNFIYMGVIETRENCDVPSNVFWEVPNRAIIRAFKGDWIDATMIYRNWATQQFWCDKGPMYSRQMPHDSINVTITIESNFFEKNALYQNQQLNAADTILSLLGDKMKPIIHLRSWKYQTPYFGSSVVADWGPFIRTADSLGYRVMPYTNTNHWTISAGDDLDSTQFKSRAININGNPYYDGVWSGQIMNPEDIAWRNKFYNIADTIFNSNALAATDIYMDYPPHVKLDWNPRHSKGGGSQWFQNFRLLSDSATIIGKNFNPDALFFQEGRFEGDVDIYNGFIYPDWENVTSLLKKGCQPIPVFEVVFGDYIINTSSAGYSLRDSANTNFNKMKYLYTYSMVNGKFFGYTADTIFFHPNGPEPDEIKIVNYVGDLVRLKVNCHSWYFYGSWQRPPIINSDSIKIYFPDIQDTINRPAVESGAMRLNDEALLLFSNHTEFAQTINPNINISDYSIYNNRWLVTKDTLIFLDVVGSNINETVNLQPNEAIGWLLLDSALTSDDEFIDKKINLQVYPNPAENELCVSYNIKYNSSITIDILTLDGKIVLSYSNNLITKDKQIHSINIENLQSGTYIIRLSTEQEIIAKKLIVLQ